MSKTRRSRQFPVIQNDRQKLETENRQRSKWSPINKVLVVSWSIVISFLSASGGVPGLQQLWSQTFWKPKLCINSILERTPPATADLGGLPPYILIWGTLTTDAEAPVFISGFVADVDIDGVIVKVKSGYPINVGFHVPALDGDGKNIEFVIDSVKAVNLASGTVSVTRSSPKAGYLFWAVPRQFSKAKIIGLQAVLINGSLQPVGYVHLDESLMSGALNDASGVQWNYKPPGNKTASTKAGT